MRIALGCDHGGFPLKAAISAELSALGHEIIDVGAVTLDPNDDYPDFAEPAAYAVARGQADRAIVVCGSGVGACVAANKVPGVRAATCHDTYSAHQGVEHDDMNVLCLGARVIGPQLAIEIVRAFAGAQFSNADRHRRRLAKVLEIERRSMNTKEVLE